MKLRVRFRMPTIVFLAVALGGPAIAQPKSSCQIDSAGGKIKHVIQIIFDNVHFEQDNPNVASDLQQMPNLLNFIQTKGVLDANHHAVLISHTANDELTFLTGVYGDRHGVPVANSFGVFQNGVAVSAPSFFYWTNRVSDVASTSDSKYGMLTGDGRNAPAPWVPFTRAGCDVGTFSNANIVIETPSVDVPTIFGPNSSEAKETSDQQFLDFEGAAIHCAKSSPVCSKANHAAPDVLPQEPQGYDGFDAVYGLKYMNLALGPLKDLDGNVISGFPGFSPTASQSLGLLLDMQVAGIPVTYAYIADLHDSQTTDNSFGPGEPGYEAQIRSYNDAFGKFFAQLKANGIDESNTLFIVTADEGDHFVGGSPSPMNCDGVFVPCSYSQIGALDVNLQPLVPAETGNNTAFDIHFDMAPTVYIRGNPDRTSSITRQLERDFSQLTAQNPITKNLDKLTVALADPIEMGLLHMITADAARTPSFTMFGAPDYFFLACDVTDCGSGSPTEDPTTAWNHGGIQPEIAQSWLGMVGPGVKQGSGGSVAFSDHTDVRPTVLALTGLLDDYATDGRVLSEVLDPTALPESFTNHSATLLNLGRIYKQINAPFGQLGLTSLTVSTFALASNSANDKTFTNLEEKIADWRSQRDSLADKMKDILTDALQNKPINEQQAQELIQAAQALLSQVAACATNVAQCSM